jgi:thymidylate synthase ThyX
MTISAEIIVDSISPENIRLTTMQLRYPRFIHSEFMTHRTFSRNASSSRAIPVERLIEDIQRDTAMPMHWGKNKPGMQADEECNAQVRHRLLNPRNYDLHDTNSRETAWIYARDLEIEAAEGYHKAGYHKQIVNRLLEPFAHINVLCSSTYWANFFHLRDDPAAMPEIQGLAVVMKEALELSKPTPLDPGMWHLPYIKNKDRENLFKEASAGKPFAGIDDSQKQYTDILIRCSVARCARVSYLTNEMKTPTVEGDLKLYDRLVGSSPLHASPAEHVATPDTLHYGKWMWAHPKEHGNYIGWRQHRKMLNGEFVNEYAESF